MDFPTTILILSIPIAVIAGILLISVQWQIGKTYGIDFKKLNNSQKTMVKAGGILLSTAVLLFFIGFIALLSL